MGLKGKMRWEGGGIYIGGIHMRGIHIGGFLERRGLRRGELFESAFTANSPRDVVG